MLLRPVIVRAVALTLAVASARLFFIFGRAVEPQGSPLGDLAAAVLFGVAAHMGLFLSADAFARALWYRRLAFALMLPAALVLGASTFDAARRAFAGNPVAAPVVVFYAAGLTAYLVQLVAVIRSGLGGGRPTTS